MFTDPGEAKRIIKAGFTFFRYLLFPSIRRKDRKASAKAEARGC
jgi:hypothetical protein